MTNTNNSTTTATTSTTSIFTATSTSTISGFTFKPGYIALVAENGEILAATSGWECNNQVYVYRPNQDGTWSGNWESSETFPILEALSAIRDWQEEVELEKAQKYLQEKVPHISETKIVFVDVVAGSRHNDGGEYGFYTVYTPIPSHDGIYNVGTSCTCEFDKCGTGYQGIRALTETEFKKLKKASDKIEAAGSKY